MIRYRIAEFLQERDISIYRFWRDTGLSKATAYRLLSDSAYTPTREVLNKICTAYQVQPGDILEWVEDH